MPDLKTDELPSHLSLGGRITVFVVLQPLPKVLGLSLKHLAHPGKTAGVILVGSEPIKSILLPQLPLAVRGFRRNDVSESLEKYSDRQVS